MEYQILERMFKGENPSSVLEIGCGSGGLLKDLTNHYPGLKVAGIDISTVAIKEAREILPEGKFIQASLLDPWPLADKSYDIVFSVGVLMYIFEPVFVMQEMLRVAKKVIIAEYHHQELDLYGHLTRGYFEDGKTHTGIIRNYFEVLQKAGGPTKVGILDSGLGKTIIKTMT